MAINLSNIRKPTSIEVLKAQTGKPWICFNCANNYKLQTNVSTVLCTCHKSEQRRLEVVAWLKRKARAALAKEGV